MCKCRSHGTFPLFGLQSSHLNICYYHQDLHRRPLRPGSRPRFCSDRRALLLIEAWLLPRRPGIGRALQRHPFSGLVDSADERFARQYRCGPPPEFPLASPRSGIVHHLSGPDRHAHTRTLLRRSRSVGSAPTPWSVFQDGSNGSPQADALSTQMPRHAVRRVLQTTIKAATSPRAVRARRGSHPLWRPFPGTWARSVAEDASPDYNSNAEDVRISSWALPGLWVIESFWTGTTDDITRLEFTTACRDAPGALSSDFGQPRAKAWGATCVQRLDGSRDSAIHTKYRISLRSSSMREPRYPLPRVVLDFTLQHYFRTNTVSGLAKADCLVACSLTLFVPGFGEIRKLCARSDRDLRYDNDPSAGSPTETLLRLLLPLNDKV
ncbi:hypothetical protein Bca101_101948 [Brassica carinata]